MYQQSDGDLEATREREIEERIAAHDAQLAEPEERGAYLRAEEY